VGELSNLSETLQPDSGDMNYYSLLRHSTKTLDGFMISRNPITIHLRKGNCSPPKQFPSVDPNQTLDFLIKRYESAITNSTWVVVVVVVVVFFLFLFYFIYYFFGFVLFYIYVCIVLDVCFYKSVCCL
jgi:hypothetical protein